MNIRQALIWGAKILRGAAIPSANLDSEILLTAVIKKPREFFDTYPEQKISSLQVKKFSGLIAQRRRGKPIAYLTNTKEFYGRNFYVDQRVLIPRPETEPLIETVIKFLPATSEPLPTAIADIGTGSGCIIISLAKEFSTNNQRSVISYYATDVSKPALTVARYNARRHQVKIIFRQGNLLTPLNAEKIDIVIANLPYVRKAWQKIPTTENTGLRFEPRRSLFTKENGLYLYRLFFEQLARRQQKPRLVLCEFDPRQLPAIKRLITKNLPMYRITQPSKFTLALTSHDAGLKK